MMTAAAAAPATIAGYSSCFHRATAFPILLAGPPQRPREKPHLAQQPTQPTLTANRPTPNSRRISSRTISVVHKAKYQLQLPRVSARDQRLQPTHFQRR